MHRPHNTIEASSEDPWTVWCSFRHRNSYWASDRWCFHIERDVALVVSSHPPQLFAVGMIPIDASSFYINLSIGGAAAVVIFF